MGNESNQKVVESKDKVTIIRRIIVAVAIGIFVYFLYQDGLLPWKMQNYGGFLAIMTSFSILLASIEIYFNKIINRRQLGWLFFGFIGSIAYLGNIPLILSYYDRYPGTLLFLSMLFIGLLCIVFTESGFFDKQFEDRKLVQNLSIRLLVILFVIMFCVFFLEYKTEPQISLILSLGFFDVFYQKYLDQLSGKKRKPWKFKW